MPNFTKLAKSIKENKERSEAQRALYFVLKESGQKAIIRFNGSEEEPYEMSRHYLARMSKYVVHREKNCVACYHKQRGRPDVGFNQSLTVFNIIDKGYFHFRKTKDDRGNERRSDFQRCLGTPRCPGCLQKLDKERGKQRYWQLAKNHALNSIVPLEAQLREKCRSCGGRGDISARYLCANEACETEFEGYAPEDDGQEIVTCQECGHEGAPREALQCNNCEEPQRASLSDTDIVVTRVGQDTSTAYNMIPKIPFVDVEPWMQECVPYNLEQVCAEPTTSTQAAQMGVPDPFGEAPSQSYDEPSVKFEKVAEEEVFEEPEEEGEEEEGEDEQEDDGEIVEPPAPPVKPVAAPKKTVAMSKAPVAQTRAPVAQQAPAPAPAKKTFNFTKPAPKSNGVKKIPF